MDYTYRVEWSEEDGVYIARVDEWPSLACHAASPEAARAELEDVILSILDEAYADFYPEDSGGD